MNKEQFIHIDTDGNKRYYSDREMIILHREDGPAIEWSDGSKSWLIDNKRHREDGPAYEGQNGSKEWWLNDERHREDGHAVEWGGGYREWHLNGVKLTEEEFNARIGPVTEMTLDDIAEKFGIQEVKSVTIKFQTSTPYTNEQNSRTN